MVIVGNFNYIRYPHNRNIGNSDTNNMLQFNEAMNNLALVEVPLKGRNFIWWNVHEAPFLKTKLFFLPQKAGQLITQVLLLCLFQDLYLIIPPALCRSVLLFPDSLFLDLRTIGCSIMTSEIWFKIYGIKMF